MLKICGVVLCVCLGLSSQAGVNEPDQGVPQGFNGRAAIELGSGFRVVFISDETPTTTGLDLTGMDLVQMLEEAGVVLHDVDEDGMQPDLERTGNVSLNVTQEEGEFRGTMLVDLDECVGTEDEPTCLLQVEFSFEPTPLSDRSTGSCFASSGECKGIGSLQTRSANSFPEGRMTLASNCQGAGVQTTEGYLPFCSGSMNDPPIAARLRVGSLREFSITLLD